MPLLWHLFFIGEEGKSANPTLAKGFARVQLLYNPHYRHGLNQIRWLFTGYWSPRGNQRNAPQLSRLQQQHHCSRRSACNYQMKPDNAWEPPRACCVTMTVQPSVRRDAWWSSAAIDLAHILHLMVNSLWDFIFTDYKQMCSSTTPHCKALSATEQHFTPSATILSPDDLNGYILRDLRLQVSHSKKKKLNSLQTVKLSVKVLYRYIILC